MTPGKKKAILARTAHMTQVEAAILKIKNNVMTDGEERRALAHFAEDKDRQVKLQAKIIQQLKEELVIAQQTQMPEFIYVVTTGHCGEEVYEGMFFDVKDAVAYGNELDEEIGRASSSVWKRRPR